jgi:hypothetical protein
MFHQISSRGCFDIHPGIFFLGRIHLGYCINNNSPDKLANTHCLMYCTLRFQTPLQHESRERHCFLKKVTYLGARATLRHVCRRLPLVYHVRYHSTIFYIQINSSEIEAR